jgi:hypothetical protein
MKSQDELIYDLIFSTKTNFKIDVGEYIIDIYKYNDFVDKIKEVLKKSKVSIIESQVGVDTKGVTWILKVKK